MSTVLVPRDRFGRWVDNFVDRHGATEVAVADEALCGAAVDGSRFVARLPFDQGYDGRPTAAAFAEEIGPLPCWGVLLVRRGGFAVARLSGDRLVEHKVGQRHVQGRTKAGGQSQQRFARRRDNQARQAFEAAGEHAARILVGDLPVVVGGDAPALHAVLGEPGMSRVQVVGPRLAVGDPRRAVLDQAVHDATCAVVEVSNATVVGDGVDGP